MSPRTKILSLVVVLAMIMLALSSAFSGIASDPLLDRPLHGGGGDTVPQTRPSFLDMSWPPDGDEVLFRVISANGLAYLRTGVYTDYTGTGWEGYTEDPQAYTEGTAIDVEEGPSVDLAPHYAYVQPVLAMESALPIAQDTSKVVPEEDLDLSYDQETQTMQLDGTATALYRIEFDLPSYDQAALRAAGVAPDDRYLGVPGSLSPQLTELAELIVQGAGSSYDKAAAIAEYLEKNYAYDLNFSRPPAGTDPVEWFLFNSKEGVCTHFNSAFVLLVRSLGIPARMCGGYLIDPDAPTQDVVPNMAHAYAEIKLDGIGWVLFDATPSADEGSGGGTTPENGPAISGQVYTDRNGNGVQDPEDAGLAGRTVVLSDRSGGTVSVTQTDGAGAYSFASVEPGSYSVQLSPVEGWLSTTPSSVNVTFDGEQAADVDFGVVSDGGSPESTAPGHAPSGPWPWPLLLALFAVPLAAAGAVYYRKRTGRGPAASRTVAPMSPPGPYAISFPQIAAPLPDVWGAGEPLRVEVRGAGGTAAVSVDGRDVRTIELKEGTARFSLDLPAGEHAITVRGVEGRSERKVRVVRYREEVGRLYREALASWKKAWPEVRDDLTPREVASVLARKTGADGPEASAALLEIAEYSTHPVTRKEFEMMHRALGKVRG